MKSQTASGGGGAAPTEVLNSKKEKVIPQATAEQLRIAEITNISNEQDIVDLNKKIRTIVECTQRTSDEAAMALHDSNGSVEDAINMLLEGGSPDFQGWETTGKKKKDKAAVPEVRKEDTRRATDDRGGRVRGRAARSAGGHGGTAPATGGRPRPPRGPGALRSREGRPGVGRDNNQSKGSKSGRDGGGGGNGNNANRLNAGNGTGGNNSSSHWNNGNLNEDDFKPQNKSDNLQDQPNDTIGNMGNWDDFKADQKESSEWSAKKDRQSEWADAVGDQNNREWKSRHRHGSHQGVQGGKPIIGQSFSSKAQGQSNVSRGNELDAKQQSVLSDSTNKLLQQQKLPPHLSQQQQQQQQQQGGNQRLGNNRQAIQQTTGTVQQSLAPRTKVRLPPASKTPQTPVEMPPDHLDLHSNSLDVSFGALTFGSNSFEPISSLSQNQQPNKVEHNGAGLPSGAHLQHGSQTTASNVQQLKPQTVIDVTAKNLQSGQAQQVDRDRSSQVAQQVAASIAVPPGLDKSAVNSVAPSQTHKAPSMTGSQATSVTGQQANPSSTSAVPSTYHSQAQAVPNQVSSSNASSSYQQYSANTAYKQQQQQQPQNNMAYLHSLGGIYNTGHSTTQQYSQQASQPYGSAANYSSAFGGSSVASGYKGKDGASVGSTTGSAVSVSDSVTSSATSQYDSKKTASQLQQQVQQQAQQQTMQPGGLVLQPGQLHGPHVHAAAPYMTGHPGPMQPLYPYYTHHVPPGSGTHLATDYQQQQRENSTSSATSAGITQSSLLQQQQHSYADKFVRSQDDSSSASASQVSSTAGSQSTITATAAYPHVPYNYYGVQMVHGTYPPMPFMSAPVTGYPATGTASSASQASKSSSAYGTGNTAFDYQLSSHLTSPGGDYNKYQTNKMMSNANKYMSAATAAERR